MPRDGAFILSDVLTYTDAVDRLRAVGGLAARPARRAGGGGRPRRPCGDVGRDGQGERGEQDGTGRDQPPCDASQEPP
jgi:hypothetical protein